MNPYEVLEITPGASSETIKDAYHRLAKKWHPDRFTGPAKEEAELHFRQVAEAFASLKDVGKREEQERKATESGPSIQLQEEVPQVPPSERTVEDWYSDAKRAMEAKDYDRAQALIQYALRMDSTRAEFFVLLAQAMEAAGGDKKKLAKTLETAVRLNPKDVDSTVHLAELFQSFGMYARATRLWETAHNLNPNHPVFTPTNAKSPKAEGKPKDKGKNQALAENLSFGEQFTDLINKGRDLFQRITKRG